MRLWGRLLLTAFLSLGAFSVSGAILDEPSTWSGSLCPTQICGQPYP
jgi:hypothetical protein